MARKSTQTVNEVKVEKAPAKRTTAKKAEIILQFCGNDVNMADIEKKVKAQYVSEGNKVSSIRSFSIYVKPEEHSAYYVINGDITGRVDLY
jgi:hypothetical protein